MNFNMYVERRKKLCKFIIDKYKTDKGIVCLIANYEPASGLFRQESSFYYLTGLQEPGLILTIDLSSGSTLLFVPAYGMSRTQWMDTTFFDDLCKNPARAGIEKIVPLGNQVAGYSIHHFGHIDQYAHFIMYIQTALFAQKTIFSPCSDNPALYIPQRTLWLQLNRAIPTLQEACIDIHFLIADMRRVKNMQEIEAIFKAVEITMLAQETVAGIISNNVEEAEVHGNVRYIMCASGAMEAFPSIVGSGKNSTVLHYHSNNKSMHDGDLVVVDIGAEKNMYAADITRTYPVSGKFSDRQKEIYTMVLETQNYIASLAKPGMWLRNKEVPEQSLHHLAKVFLDKKGYGHYFVHGIGHYLGLDVHDVGSYAEPLQEGDVFTIEPGIYIQEESLGIRIEDNYWMTEKGALCLSEDLAKTIDEIELLMKTTKLKDKTTTS
ncbi:MAG TPA: aminopeptidase P N-terminal domain-containing protein [Patescibacteria group bacterium]|nr:aminopeptidase P N-terminal domain-containing protein [Patescibacteria group bacterium]